MRALAREGGEALAQTVETVASRPLQAVPAEAFIYRAIGRMSRLGIRHLGSVDKGGHIIGALSARDLLRVRGNAAVSLGDEIDEADGVHATFADLILRQQIEDIDRGRRPTNTVEVRNLSRRDRDRLRAALRGVQPLETLVHDLLFRG